MKNIILTLLIALTLCLRFSYSQSNNDTVHSWNSEEVELMANLIPLLYKDVLRYDSCRSDAKILDSMVMSLNFIIEAFKVSDTLQAQIITKLNLQLDEHNLILERQEKKIKLIKKASFWRGFKWGSGVTGTIIIVLLVIIL